MSFANKMINSYKYSFIFFKAVVRVANPCGRVSQGNRLLKYATIFPSLLIILSTLSTLFGVFLFDSHYYSFFWHLAESGGEWRWNTPHRGGCPFSFLSHVGETLQCAASPPPPKEGMTKLRNSLFSWFFTFLPQRTQSKQPRKVPQSFFYNFSFLVFTYFT